MGSLWKVEMLGTFEAKSQGRVVSRFRTRRVASLLAYLALHQQRVHTRDEIAELLWPGADELTSRRNLRQAIHSLKKVLEPPTFTAGSVLKVNQTLISLNPDGVTTDAAEMEKYSKAARLEPDRLNGLHLLKQAIAVYKGDLLPGFDDLWVMNERFRMEDLYLSSLKSAVSESLSLNQTDEAIQFLRLAIAKEPLDESLHKSLIQQYLNAKRPRRALEQYQEISTILQEELSCLPGADLEALAEKARRELGNNTLIKADKAKQSQVKAALFSEPEKEVPPSIPLPVTRFFGRTDELMSIHSLVAQKREKLVSLLGPAGTGKTRLSIEFAHQLSQHGWKIWFVPLADINTSNQILDLVMDIVIANRDQNSGIDRLTSVLNKDQTLLILDNFEHIHETGLEVLKRLRHLIPNAAIIVTSRQSLNLEGEVQFNISPLPIPKLTLGQSGTGRELLAELSSCPSVQMLIDRCQMIRPDAQITQHNARHFISICEKLEGIPLAIEIAAGLSKSSVPSQIVKQLDSRLLALASRRRDAPARHQSLRAAIDYSYHTLTPELRGFFASLSVFKGGFSVESVCRVCGPLHNNEHHLQSSKQSLEVCNEHLLQLQERSLIQVDHSESENAPLRYRMLESFREYGEELLSEQEFKQLQQNHAAFYVESQLSAEDAKNPECRAKLHALIKHDYNNYIAAIEFLLSTRQIKPLIQLLITLSTAWDVRGTKEVERRYIRTVVDLPETESAPPQDRIRLYRIHATTYLRNSEFKAAYASCERALHVAQEINDSGMMAECYFGMSLCAGYLGENENCIELSQQVLAHAPKSNSVLLERTYVSIGSAHWARDEFELAEEAFFNARQVSQNSRDGEPDALILAHIAGLCIDQNRLDEGMKAASEGIRIGRRRDDDISLTACLAQVARYHCAKGNLPAAIATCREALIKVRNVGISMQCLEVLRSFALILSQAEDYAKSASLIAATLGAASMQKASDHREVDSALDTLRTKLTPGEFEEAWAHGLAMSMDEAFDFALNLPPI